MNPLLTELTESIKTGKRKVAEEATTKALGEGLSPQEILDALVAGMDDVGRRFKANEIFVPEVLVAARAMKTAMEILEPELVKSGISPDHTVVLGTVEGDLHDIGKNLVGIMLKGANFNVVDLGTNVSADKFVEAATESNADVIALSALLTTTMPAMKDTVDRAKEKKAACKIIVGGAPVTDAYASEIGADGYAPDAASAVDTVRGLVASA
jgi:5-methyltetrahydrofolate--homocysteine methyltransferase